MIHIQMNIFEQNKNPHWELEWLTIQIIIQTEIYEVVFLFFLF